MNNEVLCYFSRSAKKAISILHLAKSNLALSKIVQINGSIRVHGTIESGPELALPPQLLAIERERRPLLSDLEVIVPGDLHVLVTGRRLRAIILKTTLDSDYDEHAREVAALLRVDLSDARRRLMRETKMLQDAAQRLSSN